MRWGSPADANEVKKLVTDIENGSAVFDRFNACIAEIDRATAEEAADKKARGAAASAEMKQRLSSASRDRHAAEMAANADRDAKQLTDRFTQGALVVTCEKQIVGVVIVEAQNGN